MKLWRHIINPTAFLPVGGLYSWLLDLKGKQNCNGEVQRKKQEHWLSLMFAAI